MAQPCQDKWPPWSADRRLEWWPPIPNQSGASCLWQQTSEVKGTRATKVYSKESDRANQHADFKHNGVEMTDTPHWELFICNGLCVTFHNLTAALKKNMKEEEKDLSSHFLSHPIEACLEQQSPENGRINALHLWTDTFFLSDLSKSQGKAGLPRWQSGKEATCQCRRCGFNPWVQEDALEKEMATCSSIIRENPMDRGAWWATVNGAAKSRAWLCTYTHIQGNASSVLLPRGHHGSG